MPIRPAIIVFDLLVLYIIFGHSLWQRFLPQRQKLRGNLKDAIHHLNHYLLVHGDTLTDARIQQVKQEIARATDLRAADQLPEIQTYLDTLHERWEKLIPARPSAWLKEYLEVFVVALALAFGVRGLFLQPFKIPTGSMQPTLFGIHFVHQKEPVQVGPVKRFFDYAHYSRRYVNAVVQQAGDLERIEPKKPAIPFFPATVVTIGGVRYELPGAQENVYQYCPRIDTYVRSSYGYGGLNSEPLHFEKGEVIANGWLELGDHLFVDRTRYCYAEPQRGDVTVFLTDNIKKADGSALGGRFYIKRLAGLPGEELQIRDHQLYVKALGSSEFMLVDGAQSPAYGRMYSFMGGYKGYCHFPGSSYLNDAKATFKLGPDEYFMLGDNSESSSDSRFWGVVPRANLVGRASFSWWPFSRRWGRVDTAEPEANPTPPTMQ